MFFILILPIVSCQYSNEGLTEVPTTILDDPETLDLSYNNISDILNTDFMLLTRLTVLSLSSNALSSFPNFSVSVQGRFSCRNP